MSGFSPGPWRVGRAVGRTIYDGNDKLIGMMDTREDARIAAAATEMHALLRHIVSCDLLVESKATAVALLVRIGTTEHNPR